MSRGNCTGATVKNPISDDSKGGIRQVSDSIGMCICTHCGIKIFYNFGGPRPLTICPQCGFHLMRD